MIVNGRHILRWRGGVWYPGLIAFGLIVARLPWPRQIVSGQTQALRADAIVLVNSASAGYQDFARYIQPYLDHFGVPYTVVDIATGPVPEDAASFALIVIGHSQLDIGQNYLDAVEQSRLSSAVNQGVGLVNFDNALADANDAPRYPYVQEIFGFGYVASSAATNVAINSNPPVGGYVVAAQATNATYSLNGSLTPQGVILPASASALALIGGQPLLVVTAYGQGRAVQWTSYSWMNADTWGYVHGFDDLIWRGWVWAARKPFVMQGLPPYVVMRVDDGIGPFGWVDAANRYGWKPWVGFFLDSVTDIPHMKQLVDDGGMTVSIHARTDSDFFYFNHDTKTDLSDAVVAQNFADGTNWHTQHQIPISKFVLPHYYEFGSNVFAGLRDWGVEFVGTFLNPGEPYWGAPALLAGPFSRYEVPCTTPCSQPFYYADFLSIPGHPEFDGQFFDVFTEIRDVAGYEWYPSNDVPLTTEQGVAQLKRGLDGMDLATLFTHEYYIQDITPSNWEAILAGVTVGIASYQPEYVTLDDAAQYVRAMHTSAIASSVYDPSLGQLNTTLVGSTDLPTRFYLFTEQGGAIESTFVTVPVFSASVVVSTSLQAPTPTATVTPGPSPTSTPTRTQGPTLTFTPTATSSPAPSSTPAATPTATLTPTLTDTPTATASPTGTATPTPTPTLTQGPTLTPTGTSSPVTPSNSCESWQAECLPAGGESRVYIPFIVKWDFSEVAAKNTTTTTSIRETRHR